MANRKTVRKSRTRRSLRTGSGTRKKTISQSRKNKRSNKKITLKNNKMQLYVGSKLQTSKLAWVAVSDGYIYISRDNNRSYWVLRKMKPQERPKITFNDKKRTLRIGSNKIVINGEKDYDTVKMLLESYSK